MNEDTGGAAGSNTRIRLIFAIIVAAYFLDVIDASIVQVALPSIRTQFLASLPDSQWIVGAYGLTLAGFLMLMGRAGDVWARRESSWQGLSYSLSHPSLAVWLRLF